MINTKPNTFLQILSSIPVILVILYFSKFLGIILILFRFFLHKDKNRSSFPILLVGLGLIILIPRAVYEVLKIAKIDINSIPILDQIISSSIYSVNLIKYSKALIFIGIIIAIILYVAKIIYNKAVTKLTNEFNGFIQKEEQKDREIKEKNDLIMREKREKAKNTHFVKCSYCGADNVLTSKIGTCKYCRRKIVVDKEN